ncbi:MAG: ABC transporter ATP-binding protein [Deltaproteobacteria bacterium]|nr:ABC transporter ATP-binding protein [Deltaproteobacteria bacterium]RLB92075.1 MAG: hypothetical protein DRH10_00295 [Deltaproteobacteria bacterium]RLB92934.1 MAG: hypothetical protein DRH50_08820 [Deltaproteobacteria bacterium]
MKEGKVILECCGLRKRFGGLMVLNNISFQVPTGKITALIGPNGAGKTTVLNAITGVFPLDEGNILFKGHSLNGLKSFKVVECGIARTFQNVRIFPDMTVLDNVMVGCHAKTRSGFIDALLHLPAMRREETAIRQCSIEVIERLGISEKDTLAGSLSLVGQKKVEIARALASRPELLMLDEPASGLSGDETRQLAKALIEIGQEGITILLIEHDMNLVMGISDHVVVLNYGEKIADGPPESVQKNDRVLAAYLGC